jgi:ATP-binding cassette, subfamily G (WHITE), member 2, SNQ2
MVLLFLTEINSDISEVRPIILFKRGTKAAVVTDVGDEEKAGNVNNDSGAIDSSSNSVETEKPPKMTNTFSWQHLQYTVTSRGRTLHLLNDVSGYVAPGKLTALMGESGAGKVS